MLVESSLRFSLLDAHVIAGVLQAHGLQARVMGELSDAAYPGFGFTGCTVAVPEEQVADAAEILSRVPETTEEAVSPPSSTSARGESKRRFSPPFTLCLLAVTPLLWLMLLSEMLEQQRHAHERSFRLHVFEDPRWSPAMVLAVIVVVIAFGVVASASYRMLDHYRCGDPIARLFVFVLAYLLMIATFL